MEMEHVRIQVAVHRRGSESGQDVTRETRDRGGWGG